MKDLLYQLVDGIAWVHGSVLTLNDRVETNFSDKTLHFLVIGALGLSIYGATQFVFSRLAKSNVAIISWIYTLTVVVFITFAIEIGQYVTQTGSMEFMDIVRGLEGVVVFGAVYAGGAKLLRWLAPGGKERQGSKMRHRGKIRQGGEAP